MHTLAWDDGTTAQKTLKRVISAQTSDLQRKL